MKEGEFHLLGKLSVCRTNSIHDMCLENFYA